MALIRMGFAVLIIMASNNIGWAQSDKSAAPSPGSGDLFKGTPEEQAACSPDAVKFCRDDLADSFKVLACLQDHRDKLKKACLDVLTAHGQ